MKRLIRRICKDFFWILQKNFLILWFKLMGPPPILHYDSYINKAILRAFGAKIGDKVTVCPPVILHAAEKGYANLTIEDECFINPNVFFDLTAQIIIKKGASLATGVIIMTHNNYNVNLFLKEHMKHTCGEKSVVIGEGSGVKAGALITMGVTIGKDVVVGGGSVVNRDVPDNCFVAGVPARLIKVIGEEPNIQASQNKEVLYGSHN